MAGWEDEGVCGVNVRLFLGPQAGFLFLGKIIQKSVFFFIKFSFINVTKPET